MDNLPLNLITFPLWWYTTGWNLLWSWNQRQVTLGLHQTGITLFMRHVREPLYGDYTRSGRALGLFFRIFLLILKSVLLIVRLVLLAFIDAVFLVLLPVLLALIIYQLYPVQ